MGNPLENRRWSPREHHPPRECRERLVQLIVPRDQKKQNAHDTREHSVMPCVNRKPVMLSTAVLVGCVALATVAHGQSLRSDRKEQVRSSDKPGMSRAPSASGGELRYR